MSNTQHLADHLFDFGRAAALLYCSHATCSPQNNRVALVVRHTYFPFLRHRRSDHSRLSESRFDPSFVGGKLLRMGTMLRVNAGAELNGLFQTYCLTETAILATARQAIGRRPDGSTKSAHHRLHRYCRSSSCLLNCRFKLRGAYFAGVLCHHSLLCSFANAAEFGIAECKVTEHVAGISGQKNLSAWSEE